MKIRLSKLAQLEYNEIIFNLADEYNDEKAIKFEEDFQSNVNQLKKFPLSFGAFYETNKRKFMVNSFITVIYRVDEVTDSVEILTFWHNRSNQEVLLQHL